MALIMAEDIITFDSQEKKAETSGIHVELAYYEDASIRVYGPILMMTKIMIMKYWHVFVQIVAIDISLLLIQNI
jgi:hypothetical protein